MNVRHRNFAHKKPEQLVYLELGGGNGGMLLSISDEGFRFRAVSPVRANGVVPFAFSLDGNQRLEGGGVIEWVEEDGKSGGLRFTEVSPEFRAALADWMFSDFSHNSPRREATSTVAAPPDSMEKIRQELRSGYPQRPSESHSESRIPDRKLAPGAPDRTAKSIIPEPEFESESESESEEPQTAKRLFPLPLSSSPENFKPATAASAFLKPSPEAKSQPASPVGAVFVPSAAPSVPVARIPPVKADVSPQPRPHIPLLEESFEHAWERAKLTAPPDSTHLSRAAAGGIIAIALSVILGALAYNFRQDIGAIFIRMGQSISGDNHTAATAPGKETKTDNPPSDGRNTAQNSPQPAATSPDAAEPGNAATPITASPNENAASAAGTSPTGIKSGTTSSDGTPNSGAASVPSNGNPAESTASQLPIFATAKNGAPLDTGTGQEEFNSAREILRGSNRERELPRAVDLLWAGVKKGYVPAEVTLADLFRRGDGVEKNCDQARVLLVAAAKKGSLDARQMLELMAERGCE